MFRYVVFLVIMFRHIISNNILTKYKGISYLPLAEIINIKFLVMSVLVTPKIPPANPSVGGFHLAAGSWIKTVCVHQTSQLKNALVEREMERGPS